MLKDRVIIDENGFKLREGADPERKAYYVTFTLADGEIDKSQGREIKYWDAMNPYSQRVQPNSYVYIWETKDEIMVDECRIYLGNGRAKPRISWSIEKEQAYGDYAYMIRLRWMDHQTDRIHSSHLWLKNGQNGRKYSFLTEYIAPENGREEDCYIIEILPGSWVNMSEQEPSGPGSSEMKAKATTGTQGRYTGVPEYQLNLDISLALQKELENRGYRVVMARTDNDTAISNSERALKAYEEGGEIYVRIHANGSDDSSVNGALGMTPSYENPYVANLAEESYRLTECILNTYCNETGFNNLGIQYHDDMTGINWSKIPVMILEMGFMTNEHDDTAMQDADMQAKMVSGIADGIDLYFGDSQ